LQAPTLFTIAQDLTKMQVYAKTDESDVGQIRPSQQVTFKVDAYPRDTFTGTVSQVRMNSTIVQNVVTYDTIIDFDNPEMKLFPGMTAYVTIPVATASAVKVPNGALRYKPDLSGDEIHALYQQYGLPETSGPPAQDAASQEKGGGHAQTSRTGRPPAPEPAGPRYDTQIVWKLLADKSLQPVRIKTGITDHTFTALVQELNGTLKPGDDLVTGVAQGRASGGMGTPGAPRR
jgi:HlyD family secretion protein